MLSDEEKKAIEFIKSELQDEKKVRNDYQSLTGLYGNLEIEIILNLIEKQSKEIEELKNTETYKLAIIDKDKYISKDKIKEILGIEENIDNDKLLSLLQTIVDENARLEDIEDRKVQIEYNNVFNKGIKSVEDKIKAKIEYYEKIDNPVGKRVLQSLLEKE